MTDHEELQAKVGEQIERVMRELGGGFVTKWVTLVEVVDPKTGKPAMWPLYADGMRSWDIVGLLEFTRDLQRAQSVLDGLQQ